MDNPELDFQHHVLLNTLKGNLAGPSEQSCKSAWQALEWVMQSMGEQFSAHHKLSDGMPIGELLLMRDVKRFNPKFMQQWIDRFGLDSVFPPEAGDRLTALWIDKVRKSLASSSRYTSPDQSGFLAWLLERAPESAVPLDPLPALADQLEKQREDTGLDPGFQALLDQVSRRAAVHIDPVRPPLRWLPSSVLLAQSQSIDLSMPVVCPSGLTRTLGDLARLRATPSHHSDYHTRPGSAKAGLQEKDTSPSRLPKLPHGRKIELARDWVLHPDIDIDTSRARLWACIEGKQESVEQLLQWLSVPPRTHPGFPDRIEQIFRARDAFGRGIMAWMACSYKKETQYLESRIASKFKLGPEQVFSTDGAGLVEQLLIGQRNGFADDAFHGRNASDHARETLDSEIIAGPAHRRGQIIADLVDLLLPFGVQSTLAATMIQATNDPTLSAAHAWSSFFGCIRHPPPNPSSRNSFRAYYSQTGHQPSASLAKSLDRIEEVMSVAPGALALGAIEWRQWGPLFLEKCDHYEVHDGFRKILKNRLPTLERLMAVSDLHQTVPQAAPNRASPRL